MIKEFENFNKTEIIYSINGFDVYTTDETEIINLVKLFYYSDHDNDIEPIFDLIKKVKNNKNYYKVHIYGEGSLRLKLNYFVTVQQKISINKYEKEQSKEKFNL